MSAEDPTAGLFGGLAGSMLQPFLDRIVALSVEVGRLRQQVEDLSAKAERQLHRDAAIDTVRSNIIAGRMIVRDSEAEAEANANANGIKVYEALRKHGYVSCGPTGVAQWTAGQLEEAAAWAANPLVEIKPPHVAEVLDD